MAMAVAVSVGGCSTGNDESADEPITTSAPAAGVQLVASADGDVVSADGADRTAEEILRIAEALKGASFVPLGGGGPLVRT